MLFIPCSYNLKVDLLCFFFWYNRLSGKRVANYLLYAYVRVLIYAYILRVDLLRVIPVKVRLKAKLAKALLMANAMANLAFFSPWNGTGVLALYQES